MATNKDEFDTTYRKQPRSVISGKDADADTYNIVHVDANGHLFTKLVGDTGATNVALACDADGNLSVKDPNQGKFNGAVSGLSTWKEVDGKPRVSSMNYLYDIAEGNISGHTSFAKLGYNAAVGATEEDIITQGGVYPWLATASALEVVSSDANDTVAGSGVQKIRIGYLDGDYTSRSEIISLNGVTPVPLTDATVLRVNSIRATQVGVGGVAVGNITCRLVAAPKTVYRQIELGFTRGRGLTYTVPLGYNLYITSISISSGAAETGKAVVRWTGRAQVDDIDSSVKINFFQPFFEKITLDNSFYREFESPIRIPATADIKVSAVSSVISSICNCELRGWTETV
jgi:hypothetical protein